MKKSTALGIIAGVGGLIDEDAMKTLKPIGLGLLTDLIDVNDDLKIQGLSYMVTKLEKSQKVIAEALAVVEQMIKDNK